MPAQKDYTEADILNEVRLAAAGSPGRFYPHILSPDIAYNFFPDLEDPYCIIAGSRIHLFSDATRWAVIFEISGFHPRQGRVIANLFYFGNCIDYPVDLTEKRKYFSNLKHIELISPQQLEAIRNKTGEEMEQFEIISPQATTAIINGRSVTIEHNPEKYHNAGISINSHDNRRALIGYGDYIRYVNETDPDVLCVSDSDLRKCIPADLPLLMTIKKFHYTSQYQDPVDADKQELFQIIAKVLVSKDTAIYHPTLTANNHWSNWTSGNL